MKTHASLLLSIALAACGPAKSSTGSCTLGETQCVGDAVQTCVSTNGSPAWGAAAPCSSGSTCGGSPASCQQCTTINGTCCAASNVCGTGANIQCCGAGNACVNDVDNPANSACLPTCTSNSGCPNAQQIEILMTTGEAWAIWRRAFMRDVVAW